MQMAMYNMLSFRRLQKVGSTTVLPVLFRAHVLQCSRYPSDSLGVRLLSHPGFDPLHGRNPLSRYLGGIPNGLPSP